MVDMLAHSKFLLNIIFCQADVSKQNSNCGNKTSRSLSLNSETDTLFKLQLYKSSHILLLQIISRKLKS